KIMTIKARAENPRPIENLTGLERSTLRRPRNVQNAAITGASKIMNSELTDWNQVAGISQPPRFLSVKSAAKRFRAVGVCSKADQNIAAKTNSTAITRI